MLWIINEKVLPLTVFCFKYLGSLFIFNSNLFPPVSDNTSDIQLPPEIERLASSLTDLAIVNTTVNYLPEEIGNLKHLFDLTMDNTDLVSLPKTIANMKSLFSIRLDDNLRVRSLESLSGLPNLSLLTATNCSIDRLPYNLPNLQILMMWNNNLTDIGGIETLGYGINTSKHFDFSSNHIKYIRPEIHFVSHLYILNLSKNQLTSLPRQIFQITTLAVLDISHNLFDTKELNTIVKTFRDIRPDLHLIY
jgi:Leucine-rich repeat (LRR) protein